MRERGAAVPADLIDDRDLAIETLRMLLQRCEELRVNWADIVALVNREYLEPQKEPVR